MPSAAARLRLVAVLLASSRWMMGAAAPAPASAHSSEGYAIAHHAKGHLGDRFQMGATGPNRFDCSGLVYHVFRNEGLLNRIGGSRRTARGYYDYFRRHGRASTSGGQRGDLVVYGRGSHIGIYLGNGRVISALTEGVSIHGLHAVHARFTAFLHVRLDR